MHICQWVAQIGLLQIKVPTHIYIELSYQSRASQFFTIRKQRMSTYVVQKYESNYECRMHRLLSGCSGWRHLGVRLSDHISSVQHSRQLSYTHAVADFSCLSYMTVVNHLQSSVVCCDPKFFFGLSL